MKKKRLWLVCGVCLCVLAIACGLLLYQFSREDTSGAFKQTLTDYLEAMKTGTSKAVDLATFPDEIIKQEYLLSPQHIIDYEIESEDVVSYSLVAYTLLIKDNIKSDVYTRVYYFVGNLDGKYTVFINVDYVPENLRAGLNVAKYSYVDEDSLGSSGSVSE